VIVAAIGRSPAIATTFAHHGAEHKVVAASEARWTSCVAVTVN
jgi:uncharacterized protein YqhQ